MHKMLSIQEPRMVFDMFVCTSRVKVDFLLSTLLDMVSVINLLALWSQSTLCRLKLLPGKYRPVIY